jgi:hypothetical protein
MNSKLGLILVVLCILILPGCNRASAIPESSFDGATALTYVEQQVTFGPRIPGSSGHKLTRNLIVDTLRAHDWEVEIQEGVYQDTQIYNIIGFRSEEGDLSNDPLILIGAHYDTRITADRSQLDAYKELPVPGANDGASGVAVLLELSRVLPLFRHIDVQLVFFDAEDNGGINGWEWIVGSEQYSQSLRKKPIAVVIVDMIGDSEQEIYWEKSSDPFLRGEIWGVAEDLGIETFIFEEKYHIIDDHTPFLAQGVPAVDLIDFDYPYWHTTEDTLDKVSAQSLENVGVVIQEWLMLRDSLDD